jgi:hypothetical protein
MADKDKKSKDKLKKLEGKALGRIAKLLAKIPDKNQEEALQIIYNLKAQLKRLLVRGE